MGPRSNGSVYGRPGESVVGLGCLIGGASYEETRETLAPFLSLISRTHFYIRVL